LRPANFQPSGNPWSRATIGTVIVTVQQLLGHSTVTVTMRYTHTNLDFKRNAIAKLEGYSDKMQQSTAKVSPKAPLSVIASYT
jgi:hypothetical protein